MWLKKTHASIWAEEICSANILAENGIGAKKHLLLTKSDFALKKKQAQQSCNATGCKGLNLVQRNHQDGISYPSKQLKSRSALCF